LNPEQRCRCHVGSIGDGLTGAPSTDDLIYRRFEPKYVVMEDAHGAAARDGIVAGLDRDRLRTQVFSHNCGYGQQSRRGSDRM